MTTPWQHQIEALDFIRKHQRTLLAMDMGTGKSRVIVDLICGDPRIKLALITCPLSVVDVWPDQFRTHGSAPVTVVPLGSGSVAKKHTTAKLALDEAPRPLVFVINHEALWRTPFADLVKATRWDLLVVDESHRAKSPGGKFSLFLSRICNNKGMPRPPLRVGLTGTPLPNSPLDAYAQLRWINPTVFGFSFLHFRARYAVMGGYEQKQIIAYQNMDEFTRKLDSVSFKVTADEVLDLPEATHVRRTFDLSPAEKRAYKEMEDELVTEVRGKEVTAANALVKILRLMQITGGGVCEADCTAKVVKAQLLNQKLPKIENPSKQLALEDLLLDFKPGEPIVVFTKFIEDLDAVHRAAKRLKLSSLELSGRVNQLKAWQQGDAQLLGVQIDAGGVGIDLTRSHYSIYYSVGHNLGTYIQSLARTRRPGQTHPVWYYHLVAKNTIDVRVYAALQRKEDIVNAILDEVGR